jgi:lactate dehydrogenase-like 2-hydroxyacid dehydrogenase
LLSRLKSSLSSLGGRIESIDYRRYDQGRTDHSESAEGLDLDVRKSTPKEELAGIIGGYDAIIIRSATKLTADLIEAGKNLRVIGRAGIGVDNVDVEAATKKGIVVMNTLRQYAYDGRAYDYPDALLARQIPVRTRP